MERTLPRPLDWRPWAVALVLGLLFVWNLYGLLGTGRWWWMGSPSTDWSNLSGLSLADPYATGTFRWSPPAAWLWVTLVQPLGLDVWRVLHLVALALLPWRLALLTVFFAPFWSDTVNGNILTFALVSAWHAVHGNRAGIVGFAALAALVPRPLMLPVLIWIAWRHPLARWAFAVAAVIVAASSAAFGLLDDFALRMIQTGGDELAAPWNIGPSRILGAAWIPVGLVLSVILVWKGRLGWASVAATPYVFHYYLLFLLLELRDLHRHQRRSLVGKAGVIDGRCGLDDAGRG